MHFSDSYHLICVRNDKKYFTIMNVGFPAESSSQLGQLFFVRKGRFHDYHRRRRQVDCLGENLSRLINGESFIIFEHKYI